MDSEIQDSHLCIPGQVLYSNPPSTGGDEGPQYTPAQANFQPQDTMDMWP